MKTLNGLIQLTKQELQKAPSSSHRGLVEKCLAEFQSMRKDPLYLFSYRCLEECLETFAQEDAFWSAVLDFARGQPYRFETRWRWVDEKLGLSTEGLESQVLNESFDLLLSEAPPCPREPLLFAYSLFRRFERDPSYFYSCAVHDALPFDQLKEAPDLYLKIDFYLKHSPRDRIDWALERPLREESVHYAPVMKTTRKHYQERFQGKLQEVLAEVDPTLETLLRESEEAASQSEPSLHSCAAELLACELRETLSHGKASRGQMTIKRSSLMIILECLDFKQALARHLVASARDNVLFFSTGSSYEDRLLGIHDLVDSAADLTRDLKDQGSALPLAMKAPQAIIEFLEDFSEESSSVMPAEGFSWEWALGSSPLNRRFRRFVQKHPESFPFYHERFHFYDSVKEGPKLL